MSFKLSRNKGVLFKYSLAATFVLTMKLIGYIFGAIIVLFTTKGEENATTGYPSQFPGRQRYVLIKPLRGFQAFDTMLDEYWYSGKSKWIKNALTKLLKVPEDEEYYQAYYDNHYWLRWLTNLLWLWRNNSYGFARMVGYSQDGMKIVFDNDVDDTKWDGKEPCSLLRKAVNDKDQKAFLYRYKNKYVELVLGWKFPWNNDPTNKAMLATRIKGLNMYVNFFIILLVLAALLSILI